MHISQVRIKNFRQIGATQLVIDFAKGLNLLIGENNIGKTTAIEAIALCLESGNHNRNVYLTEDDFHDKNAPIEISILFEGLSVEEATDIEASVVGDKIWFFFQLDLDGRRIIPSIFCGETEEAKQKANVNVSRKLNCIYLQALRDVNQSFKPGWKNEIGRLLEAKFDLLDNEGEDVKSFEKNIEKIFSESNDKVLASESPKRRIKPIESFTEEINTKMGKLSFQGDDNGVNTCFVSPEFRRILCNIILRLRTTDMPLDSNGLGYNNLVYIAAILTSLNDEYQKMDQSNFNCLLIEEPEAHLHPQLQKLLLHFLEEEYKDVQVIVSSHSPTLSSGADIDDLIVLNRDVATQAATATAIVKSGISTLSKDFLRKFLDVTKSQLLFARKVVFVEGVSESLLFRAFWDDYFSNEEHKFYKHSIEVVNINGVAFRPYVELVRYVFSKSKIRTALVTDDDRSAGNGVPVEDRFSDESDTREIVEKFNRKKYSARFTNLKTEIDSMGEFKIKLFGARKTFEFELGISNFESKDNFIDALKALYPSASTELDNLSGLSNEATFGAEVWKFASKDKSEFAFKLLQHLSNGNHPKIVSPEHFQQAFDFLAGMNDE